VMFYVGFCRGFPAMTEYVVFLMKDLVLLAASSYFLKQDVLRAASARISGDSKVSVGTLQLPARRKSAQNVRSAHTQRISFLVNPSTCWIAAPAEAGIRPSQYENASVCRKGRSEFKQFWRQNDGSGVITRGCAQRTHN
jgi:hypothetical protein